MIGRQQNMKYNLPERVIRDISTFAKKHSVEKLSYLALVQEEQIRREVI